MPTGHFFRNAKAKIEVFSPDLRAKHVNITVIGYLKVILLLLNNVYTHIRLICIRIIERKFKLKVPVLVSSYLIHHFY